MGSMEESIHLLNDENVGSYCATDDGERNDVTVKQRSKFEDRVVLVLLSLGNCVVWSGCIVLAPFFPSLAEQKGVSTTMIGIIFSSFALPVFLFSPLFGNYMTKIGTRTLIASGLFVYGLSTVSFGVLEMVPRGCFFITISILIRFCQGVSLAAYYTTAVAVVINRFKENAATVLGIMEAFGYFGFSIGPAFGGIVYQFGGFKTPFIIIGGLSFLLGIWALWYLTPVNDQESGQRRGQSIVRLLRHPLVLLGISSVFVGGISTAFLDPLFAKHLEKFKLSSSLLGLMFTIRPLFYPATSFLFGRLSDKGFYMWLIIIAHLMCGIAFFFIGPTPLLPFLPYELWTIIIGLVILGLFFCGTYIPNIKCIQNGALELGFKDNEDTHGMVSGLFSFAIGIGDFVGPTLGAFLTDQIGFSWGLTIISVINFIVMVLILVYLTMRRLNQNLGHNHLYNDIEAADTVVET